MSLAFLAFCCLGRFCVLDCVLDFEFSTMATHARVILDTRVQLLRPSNGKDQAYYPVKLRITHDRKRRYYQTELPPLTELDWKKIEEGQRMTVTQREVFHGKREIEALAQTIIESLVPFSFPVFKKRFLNPIVSSTDSLQEMFKAHIDRLEQQNRISTASSYRCALKSLLGFHRSFNWNDLHPEFLEGYETEMIEQGKTQNTIGIYLRSLRTIVNQGRSLGLIDNDLYPFGKTSQGKYQIPSSVNVKRALTQGEVQLIKDACPNPGSRAERARDFWLFSYYINGCNIKDIAHLTWDNVDYRDGMIRFVRKKTERANKGHQVKISAVLSPIAEEVIKKYGIPSKDKTDYIFRIIDKGDSAKAQYLKQQEFTKAINIGLKQLARELGIEKNITTYTARHSHATALIHNGASLEFVMDQFKHGSMKTTMNYVDSIDDTKRKDLAKLL